MYVTCVSFEKKKKKKINLVSQIYVTKKNNKTKQKVKKKLIKKRVNKMDHCRGVLNCGSFYLQ